MREINNNKMNSVNFKGIQKVPSETPVPTEASAPAAESMDMKDLGKIPAASLGQSLVASDSIESDMKFLEKNPVLVAELNKAIDEYADKHGDEETLQMIEKMHQEFVAKK